MKKCRAEKQYSPSLPVNREKLIKSLEIIRRMHCEYLGEFCDCKFGIGEIGKSRGEQNGCCEIRTAIDLLEKMTDKEFEKTIQRKGQ